MPQNTTRLIAGAVTLIVALFFILALSPIVIIGAGERGVVFNNATGLENRILGEGVHFRVPLVQNVTKLSVKVQRSDVKAAASSQDLQAVSTDIVVNWHLNPGRVNIIYQRVGNLEVVEDRILVPAVNEVVKASTAKMPVIEIIKQRGKLKADIDNQLKVRLRNYDIVLDDVSITNIEFSPEFNAAIEQKQVAEQNAQKAKFLAEQAKNEAEAAVNKAQGEAQAQQLLQQSLNDQLLQKLAIEKWDGKMPQYYSGNSQLPFINITR